jgi:hypothetical protein
MKFVYSIFIGIIAGMIAGMIDGMIVGVGLQCRRDSNILFIRFYYTKT